VVEREGVRRSRKATPHRQRSGKGEDKRETGGESSQREDHVDFQEIPHDSMRKRQKVEGEGGRWQVEEGEGGWRRWRRAIGDGERCRQEFAEIAQTDFATNSGRLRCLFEETVKKKEQRIKQARRKEAREKRKG
jgi:hypothetical protein